MCQDLCPCHQLVKRVCESEILPSISFLIVNILSGYNKNAIQFIVQKVHIERANSNIEWQKVKSKHQIRQSQMLSDTFGGNCDAIASFGCL